MYNKRIKILSLFFTVLVLVPSLSSAQEERIPKNEYQIATHPTYPFIDGLRVDVEKRLKNPGNWLMLGLAWHSYYSSYSGGVYWPYLWDISGHHRLSGGMAELTFKHFVGYPRTRFFFLAAGASFSYFVVEYDELNYIPYEEDGLRYFELGEVEIRHNIPKLGGHVSLGFQAPTRSRVFVDGSIGLGYGYSFYDAKKYIPGGSFGFSHGLSRRGFYPTGTFRIGVRLGRL
ncbi:MAG: hypothetical protein LBH04_11125 [Tannerellaceae bacterium]|jgi:hypothetical protein|nr:hypothetical protein [Tannerellaceae bacterium]